MPVRFFGALAVLAPLLCAPAQAGGDAAHGQIPRGDAAHGQVSRGDAAHGETLYEGCQDCHSLDKNDIGPRHRGVFGRKAGSLPDFAYSDALKNANIVWDEATLDQWLADPQAFLPGAKMFYHLDQAKDRADIIEFLKTRAR